MAPVTLLPRKSTFKSCIMPLVSVRETEAQTSFKLSVTGILGLCSGAQRILFLLCFLLKGKCYFSAHKILKTLKLAGKAHVTWTGMLFLLMCCLRHLPCWWPDSKSYVRLSATAQLQFPLSPGIGDRFQRAELFWQPSLVPFISLFLGIEIFLSWFRLRYSLLSVCKQWGQRLPL